MSVTRYKSPRAPKANPYRYRVDYRDAYSTRHRKGGFLSRADAESFESLQHLNKQSIETGIAPPTHTTARKVTLAQLVEARISHIGDKTKSQRQAAVALRIFLTLTTASTRVLEVTESHLSAYAALRMKTVSAASTWRELTDVCSCLNQAGKLFPSLASWRPPARPQFSHESRRTRILDKSESDALLRFLIRPRDDSHTFFKSEHPKSYRARLDRHDALHIALKTGARHAEICQLKWSDFDHKGRTLRRVQTKVGNKVLVVPVSAKLYEVLIAREARLKDEGILSVWMFPSPMDFAKPTLHFDSQPLRRACEALGIPYGRDMEGGFVFHDTRHTLVSNLFERKVDVETARSITGHSSKTILMHYAHTTNASQRAAVQSLDED